VIRVRAKPSDHAAADRSRTRMRRFSDKVVAKRIGARWSYTTHPKENLKVMAVSSSPPHPVDTQPSAAFRANERRRWQRTSQRYYDELAVAAELPL